MFLEGVIDKELRAEIDELTNKFQNTADISKRAARKPERNRPDRKESGKKANNDEGNDVDVSTLFRDGELERDLRAEIDALEKLGEKVEKKLVRRLEADYDIEMLAPGHIITMHWDIPCEVITAEKAQKLREHTLRAIAIANLK